MVKNVLEGSWFKKYSMAGGFAPASAVPADEQIKSPAV